MEYFRKKWRKLELAEKYRSKLPDKVVALIGVAFIVGFWAGAGYGIYLIIIKFFI